MNTESKISILFVDDDQNVLDGYKRQLRKFYHVETAVGGDEGLILIRRNGPFSVVVADMRMPAMDGLEFLSNVIKIAPDTVRIMLTGNADQQTAMNAINEGQIFRFLTKPCSFELMTKVLDDALIQYQLIISEKEILEKTLIGSISILIELLSISYPSEFGRAKKLRDMAREFSSVITFQNRWELEIASLLAPIGKLTVPMEIVMKEREGSQLTEMERSLLSKISEVSGDLLAKIPRLENVSKIIRYSTSHYDSSDTTANSLAGEALPQGSRILKILGDLLDEEAKGTPRTLALRFMRNRAGWYDKKILDAVSSLYPVSASLSGGKTGVGSGRTIRSISSQNAQLLRQESPGEPYSLDICFDELLVGDMLMSNLLAADGSLLLTTNSIITSSGLESLKHFAETKGLSEPIQVAVLLVA